MKNLGFGIRTVTLMLVLVVITLAGVWGQDVATPEDVAIPAAVAEAAGESVPEPTSQTLTMLVTVIVAPIITALLRRFNVAHSLYQSINAIASVGIFIAWWYLLGEQVGPVEDWIWRGLGVAAISGSVMSASVRKADLKREFKAVGTGSG